MSRQVIISGVQCTINESTFFTRNTDRNGLEYLTINSTDNNGITRSLSFSHKCDKSIDELINKHNLPMKNGK